MKNLEVQFNTRTSGIDSSTKELRRRYRKSDGFKRLLQAAAAAQLRNRGVTLKASNPKALRALERAVCGVRRMMEVDIGNEAARQVYLMKDGKAWAQVKKSHAVRAMQETTLDTLAVMPVWVYSPSISWSAARKLDALTAPEDVYIAPEVVEFSEPRERESAHPNQHEEDASSYNDAGVLETPSERRERRNHEGRSTEHREAWEDSWKPLPLKATPPERLPVTVKALPDAPYYQATEARMPREAQAELSEERTAYQERRAELDIDHNEQRDFADIDELLSSEDLEVDMLEPWEALERFSAAQ